MLLQDDCGRDELYELEEEFGYGDAVRRLVCDEPSSDAVGSTINGYSVDPTTVMMAKLRVHLSQKHWIACQTQKKPIGIMSALN